MTVRRILAVATLVALAACSFQNKYEKEAQKITEAVMKNDLTPVQADIAPGIKITRVQVAEWSDQLASEGKLESLQEMTSNCPPGTHCFNVKFEKHNWVERLRLDDQDKVVYWNFVMAPAGATN